LRWGIEWEMSFEYITNIEDIIINNLFKHEEYIRQDHDILHIPISKKFVNKANKSV
jgi:hypothetical protein